MTARTPVRKHKPFREKKQPAALGPLAGAAPVAVAAVGAKPALPSVAPPSAGSLNGS